MKSFFNLFINSNNSFSGEEEDEKVILLLRRHPFVILIRFIFSAFLVSVPVVFWIIFAQFLLLHKIFDLFLFLSSVWYIFVWADIFYSLTMYTLDVWIVTNKRIIDSTQHGFFNRTVSELHLNRIQDISVKTEGIIQTFLHFGNLQIQTAGTEERFNFSQVPEPMKVKDEIMKLIPNQNQNSTHIF